jgi:hypothetical protein
VTYDIDIVVDVSAILLSSLWTIGPRRALTLTSQPETVQADSIVAAHTQTHVTLVRVVFSIQFSFIFYLAAKENVGEKPVETSL